MEHEHSWRQLRNDTTLAQNILTIIDVLFISFRGSEFNGGVRGDDRMHVQLHDRSEKGRHRSPNDKDRRSARYGRRTWFKNNTIDDVCQRFLSLFLLFSFKKKKGHDAESLLFAFMNECLFIFSTEFIVCKRIRIDNMDNVNWTIRATL
jgi:hypothetical protein